MTETLNLAVLTNRSVLTTLDPLTRLSLELVAMYPGACFGYGFMHTTFAVLCVLCIVQMAKALAENDSEKVHKQKILIGYLAGTVVNHRPPILLKFKIPSLPNLMLQKSNMSTTLSLLRSKSHVSAKNNFSVPTGQITLPRPFKSSAGAASFGNAPSLLTNMATTAMNSDCDFAGHVLSAHSMSLEKIAHCLQRQGIAHFSRNLQGHIISGALRYAIEKVNENNQLLPNYELDFIFADTRGMTKQSVKATMELWQKGVIAFVGPEDSCQTEAMMAAAQNLPMISYKCFDHAVSDKTKYSTFARTVPAESQISRAAISLLKNYNWRKFTIVYGDNDVNSHLLKAIVELCNAEGMQILNISSFAEPYRSTNLEDREHIRSIVAETHPRTRIYVMFGSVSALQQMLYAMDDMELLSGGEYVIIYLEPSYTYLSPDDAMMNYFYRATLYTVEEFHSFPYVNRIIDLSRSLLAIIPSPVTFSDSTWKEFWAKVNQYNMLPPFNFFNPVSTSRFGKYPVVNRYASYLYDAVMLYATALHEEIEAGGNVKNGSAIITRIFNRRYKSMQGFEMEINENGDAEGNFTLLTRQPMDNSNFNLSYGLIPSAYFIEINETLPGLLFKPHLQVDWIDGKLPEDEPPCGFHGEYCVEQPSYAVEIICGAFGIFLLITTVVSFIYYRNRKYEQELAGLIWKINPKEIQFHPCACEDNLAGSRTSIASHDSDDDVSSWTVDPHGLGVYRGSLVAIKEIRYHKRTRELSRATKIEMKKMRSLHHDNVNRFIGIIIQPNFICVVREYCAKGSLFDVLLNENIKLDALFIASFVDDLLKGMIYLHDSEIRVHGNLKSTNCCITSRWSLQVSDFGLSELREGQVHNSNEGRFVGLLWTAPELLRANPDFLFPFKGTQRADSYSFGIVLHEIFSRNGPFDIYMNENTQSAEQTLKNVIYVPFFRPSLEHLECEKYIIDTMTATWDERPDWRPDFRQIRLRLKPMFKGILKRNIMDHMMGMMEKYQSHLEELVEERTEELKEEKKRTETLLHRMLPKVVAAQLMQGKDVVPETYDSVTIYFSDIVGFTALSAESTPVQVVAFLNSLYTLFDRIIRQYDVYKVETIGDAYMVVSGLPIRNGDQHAGEIATMALELLKAVQVFQVPHKPDMSCLLRIGIHTGPCAAGVVGKTMPRYCLFGDTVNTASRMESNGLPWKIHCSESTMLALEKLGGYILEERGMVPMKGKGEMRTFWLLGKQETGAPVRLTQKKIEEPLFSSSSFVRPTAMKSRNKDYVLNKVDPCRLRTRKDTVSAESYAGKVVPAYNLENNSRNNSFVSAAIQCKRRESASAQLFRDNDNWKSMNRKRSSSYPDNLNSVAERKDLNVVQSQYSYLDELPDSSLAQQPSEPSQGNPSRLPASRKQTASEIISALAESQRQDCCQELKSAARPNRSMKQDHCGKELERNSASSICISAVHHQCSGTLSSDDPTGLESKLQKAASLRKLKEHGSYLDTLAGYDSSEESIANDPLLPAKGKQTNSSRHSQSGKRVAFSHCASISNLNPSSNRSATQLLLRLLKSPFPSAGTGRGKRQRSIA